MLALSKAEASAEHLRSAPGRGVMAAVMAALLGQRVSVVTAVAIVMCGLTIIAVVLVSQIVHIAHSLPQYESNLQLKLHGVENLRRGGVNMFMSGADDAPLARPEAAAANAGLSTPLAARVGPAPASPWRALQGIAADVRVPLESTGIVFVVFIFALLEHEALPDWFIRMTGSADLHATTIALQDAGLRLRFIAIRCSFQPCSWPPLIMRQV